MHRSDKYTLYNYANYCTANEKLISKKNLVMLFGTPEKGYKHDSALETNQHTCVAHSQRDWIDGSLN
jgi:hypothetical protein